MPKGRPQKLTADQKVEIMGKKISGSKIRELATEYHVCYEVMRRVCADLLKTNKAEAVK